MKRTLADRIKLAGIGLAVGIVLGVGGTLFVQAWNPKDESQTDPVSIVFERIISSNEMVTATQNYSIVERASDVNRLFDLIDIPFTDNSFWYRYNGTIKAGVNLENASYATSDGTITVSLSAPYVIANDPDMETSGVLEERNNVLNPIHVSDVDEFQRSCEQKSQEEAVSNGIFDEARTNAETNIRNMFNAALGDTYNIAFEWADTADGE